MEEKRKEPVFVGIAGGTASGKTTVTEEIMKRIKVDEQNQGCCMI